MRAGTHVETLLYPVPKSDERGVFFMSISRRSALGAAAALAVTSNNGVASALAGALSRRNGHSRGGSGGYQNSSNS